MTDSKTVADDHAGMRAGKDRLQVFFVSTLAIIAALGIWIRGLNSLQPGADQAVATTDWQSLFDGTTLEGWKVLDRNCFDAHGKVRVADAAIVLEAGEPATGIAYQRELPNRGYEVELEAKRADGSDFFCGLTFPVDDSFCTLIVGGWGGSVIGLSNVDHLHAGENETTHYGDFKQDQWYKIRLRVAKKKIEVWIDNERLIELKTADRKLSIWWEQEPARPMGIATWNTKAALRNLRLRRIPEE